MIKSSQIAAVVLPLLVDCGPATTTAAPTTDSARNSLSNPHAAHFYVEGLNTHVAGPGNVTTYDAAGNLLQTFTLSLAIPMVFSSALPMAVDRQGRIYLETCGNGIQILSPDGTLIRNLPNLVSGGITNGSPCVQFSFAVNSDGTEIIVSDAAANLVRIYDATGTQTNTITLSATQQDAAVGIR